MSTNGTTNGATINGHLDDVEAAQAVWKAARTRVAVPHETFRRLPNEWAEASEQAVQDGPDGIDRWAKAEKKRLRKNPDRWGAIHHALELAKEQAAKAEATGILDDDLPEIVCGSEEQTEGLKTWTPKALEALKRRNQRYGYLFQRGGKLARLRQNDDDEPPVIELFALDSLRGELDRSACWGHEVFTKRGKEIRYGPPRSEIVRDIQALSELDQEAFPPLDQVVESPRFLPDGSLPLKEGYHRAGRFYYKPHPELAHLDVPKAPTVADVEQARGLLLDDLLVDFIFKTQASKANTIACMLLPFVRAMIDGPTPNHHFGASTEGTGKTLLATVAAYPSLFRELDLSPQKESEAEWRKALTSWFAKGASHVYIDNMYNPMGWDDMPLLVDSGTLAMAWTSRYYRDRLLGGNQEVRIKIQCVFMSSGNNVGFSRELIRRIVPIDLVTECENPSTRTGFKHDPLMSWVKENRRDLVRACLTLCQHWFAEGCPSGSQIMGSYEVYTRTMGGILDACGIDGFLRNRPRAVTRDMESDRWGALIEAWYNARQRSPISTGQLHEIIRENSELSEAFDDLLGDGGQISQKARLGKALQRHENRVWKGHRIVRVLGTRTANKTAVWKLQDPADPIVEIDATDDTDKTSEDF